MMRSSFTALRYQIAFASAGSEAESAMPSQRRKKRTYSFLQLPAMFGEKDLPRLLLPFATHDRQVFVRIFHENVLETVMQLFIS